LEIPTRSVGLMPEALVNVSDNYKVTIVVKKSDYMRETLNNLKSTQLRK